MADRQDTTPLELILPKHTQSPWEKVQMKQREKGRPCFHLSSLTALCVSHRLVSIYCPLSIQEPVQPHFPSPGPKSQVDKKHHNTKPNKLIQNQGQVYFSMQYKHNDYEHNGSVSNPLQRQHLRHHMPPQHKGNLIMLIYLVLDTF